MKILMQEGERLSYYPAIAIAKHIKNHNKLADIRFVGTKRGFEDKLVKDEGFIFTI